MVGWCSSQFNVLLFGICLQASEGVPMRFFTKLDQLIEFYKKENMGLVTHLQYPVPLEEEDTGDEPEEETGRKGWRERALGPCHLSPVLKFWGISPTSGACRLGGSGYQRGLTRWLKTC